MTRIRCALGRSSLTFLCLAALWATVFYTRMVQAGPPRPGLIAPDEYDAAAPIQKPLGLSPWKATNASHAVANRPRDDGGESAETSVPSAAPRGIEFRDETSPPLVPSIVGRTTDAGAAQSDAPAPFASRSARIARLAPTGAVPGLAPPPAPADDDTAPGNHVVPPAPPAADDRAALPADTVDPGFAAAADSAIGLPQDRRYVKQCLPPGLLYKSYLAGVKEPRFASQMVNESGRGVIWEAALGGRVGVYRNGTVGAINPDGFQVDMEGAAFVRLDLMESQDVDATDYRFGIPFTWRRGPLAWKAGYYHISSHTGDEWMVKHNSFDRINYVRESAVFGVSYDVQPDVRTYAELGYALQIDGGAKRLELQFGTEYSPLRESAPFAAMNIHLREDFNFGGNINLEAGWQWRGMETNHLFRVGGQYYNGKSIQYSFFDKSEQLVGFGMWFDY